MTRDQIIKAMDWHPAVAEAGPQSLLARVERVVQQAVAEQREADAKLCDRECAALGQTREALVAGICAAVIRAGGSA